MRQPWSASTRKLREDVASGKIKDVDIKGWIKDSYESIGVKASKEKIEQVFSRFKKDLMADKEKLSGFTWHHHELKNRMELIPDWLHNNAPHTGGGSMH